jgi:hypothetical protein
VEGRKVTDAAPELLLLTDEAGHFYLVSHEVLERSRVAAEHEQAIRDYIGREDTSGFFTPVPIPAGQTAQTLLVGQQLRLLGTLRGLPLADMVLFGM